LLNKFSGLNENENRRIFTLVRSVYNLNITNIYAGGHHSWLITDNIMPERDDVDSPSALCSPTITPFGRSPQFSPRGGRDNSNTDLIKITMNPNDTSKLTNKTTMKPLITQSMKFNLDMFADKIIANRSLLQIAYSDLKMSHRFVRFSLNPNGKYKDLTHKQINSVISDHLANDSNVILFRLQDDNDVSNFKSQAMDLVFKDIKSNFKILDSSNKKNSYSLTIIYDINKNREINQLRENLENNYKFKKDKKYLCKNSCYF
jgi:hypothetical protein